MLLFLSLSLFRYNGTKPCRFIFIPTLTGIEAFYRSGNNDSSCVHVNDFQEAT